MQAPAPRCEAVNCEIFCYCLREKSVQVSLRDIRKMFGNLCASMENFVIIDKITLKFTAIGANVILMRFFSLKLR